MGASNPEGIRPAFQAIAWTLLGIVGVTSAVLGVLYGGVPVGVLVLLVLATGGLWWWQAARSRERKIQDGGRQGRPDDR